MADIYFVILYFIGLSLSYCKSKQMLSNYDAKGNKINNLGRTRSSSSDLLGIR
jgi:hypothetical protein